MGAVTCRSPVQRAVTPDTEPGNPTRSGVAVSDSDSPIMRPDRLADDANLPTPSNRAYLGIRLDRNGITIETWEEVNNLGDKDRGDADVPPGDPQGVRAIPHGMAKLLPITPGSIIGVFVAVAGGPWYAVLAVFVGMTATTIGVMQLNRPR